MNQPDIVGVISDTHGLLRPEAVEALQGSQLIIHAGDVGKPEILDDLRKIATVSAVRGNIDKTSWATELPMTEVVKIGEVTVYVLHDLNQLDLDPAIAGFSAVISGHSHRPSVFLKNGVLFLNPGSAGPRRFNLPVSVALLRVTGKTVEAQVVELRV
jgi:putative phosphoesterase